ncbi:hypothetical protein FRC09_005924 [Ceratobasidium sp. 395]|nr:hypothetical protein FRC09_005924 [Ceratobasidium sp. 395]
MAGRAMVNAADAPLVRSPGARRCASAGGNDTGPGLRAVSCEDRDRSMYSTPPRPTFRIGALMGLRTVIRQMGRSLEPPHPLSNDIDFPRTSSPTPIPEDNLRPNVPTTTTRGTQPGHAELDTPPPGTQPLELKRSDRARNLSSRAQDIVARSGKPFVGHSQAPVPEPQPVPDKPQPAPAPAKSKSKSAAAPPAKKPAKRKKPTLRFDGETSGDDDDDGAPIKLRPPKAPRYKSTKGQSPPPKRPGRHLSVAGGSKPSQRSIRLDPESIRNLGEAFGIDPETATSRTINETIRSLSDNRAAQNETSTQYTQVRGEPAAPLSSLNKKGGGYHRDILEALAKPETSTKKRHHSGIDTESSKRARLDNEPDTQNPPGRSIPPLPSFLHREPHSVSSTQRAVVHPFESQHQLTCASLPEPAYASRHDLARASQRGGTRSTQSQPTLASNSKSTRAPYESDRVRFGAGGTPIPEPRRDLFARSTTQQSAPPRGPSPSSRRPVVLVPGTPSLSPVPETRPLKPVPARKPPVAPAHKSRSDTRTPLPHRKGSTTESDSEPEPKPKPKPHPKAKSKPSTSHTASHSSTRHPHSSSRRDPSPVPSKHHGSKDLLGRLGDLLNGGDSDNEDPDALLKSAVTLLLRHQQERGQPSSSRQAGPSSSSSRQPAASSSKRHTHRRETGATDDDEPRRNWRDTPSADDDAASGDGYEPPIDLSRSGLGRYPGRRGKVASCAMLGLLSVAARRGIYQDHDVNIVWARKEFVRAWKKRYPDVPVPPFPDDLLQTIVLRISGLRTEVKKRIRALIIYLFRFRNPGDDNARQDANVELCKLLLPNTFHCRELEEDKDYYEHPTFVEAISEAFFWHQDSFAVRDQAKWQIIPLPAVAFVLTMMQDCIQEWDTGCFRARENSFRQQKDLYKAHLHGLYVYESEAADRLTGFQAAWFKAGMKHAGIRIDSGESDHEFCQPVTQARFVRPQSESESEAEAAPELSPEPEPSPEPEYVDGRLTAQSKGKGKPPWLDDFSDY